MIYSMTGFGRSSGTAGNLALSIEIKTVNHRYTDLFIKAPDLFSPYREMIRKIVNETIERGRIEVSLRYEKGESDAFDLILREDLADKADEALKKLSEKYGYKEPELSDLLKFKEIFSVEIEEVPEEVLEETIKKMLNEALDEVKQSRLREGKLLEEDLNRQLGKIREAVGIIDENRERINKAYENRLRERIEKYTGGEFDEQRILTEVAVFSEKSDINEELVRLNAHVEAFTKEMEKDGAKGRKLDFIVQEMNREANTICSKSSDAGLTGKAVDIKSYVDKLKEQVQNIE